MPVITMSGLYGSDGSLLTPVTLNKANSNPVSVELTVAAWTILLFGGQRLQARGYSFDLGDRI